MFVNELCALLSTSAIEPIHDTVTTFMSMDSTVGNETKYPGGIHRKSMLGVLATLVSIFVTVLSVLVPCKTIVFSV